MKARAWPGVLLAAFLVPGLAAADNIVVGLIAQVAAGEPYGTLLSQIVFGPAGLTQTSFPSTISVPNPFIHGYVVSPGAPPDDVNTITGIRF